MKKHTTLKSKFNSAFSLVELLVVIAVIAVIAAIAIPNITGARDAAVAAQEGYDQATYERMSQQIVAMRGGTSPTVADLQAGITINVTNKAADGTDVVSAVEFKLD